MEDEQNLALLHALDESVAASLGAFTQRKSPAAVAHVTKVGG